MPETKVSSNKRKLSIINYVNQQFKYLKLKPDKRDNKFKYNY